MHKMMFLILHYNLILTRSYWSLWSKITPQNHMVDK